MTGFDPSATRWIRLRLRLVGLLFLLLLAGIMARAVHLQVFKRAEYGDLARDQYLRELELTPRRGPILDARGQPLAISVETDSVYVDPRRFAREKLPRDVAPSKPRTEAEEKAAVREAGRLAKVLGVDVGMVKRRATSEAAFAWVKRRATPDEAKAVNALGIPGVYTTREWRRFYPQRELGAHVVGMVGIDNEGLEGIERAFDEHLRGSAQEVTAIRDVRGAHLFAEPGVPSGALYGASVQLTIDSALQHAAQESLARGVAKARAAAGVLVAMNPRTGAVLAMANVPTYNPNSAGTMAERRNRAVTDLWEPGSTMKSFVFAGAIADGLVTPESVIHVSGGELPIGKRRIHDSHPPKKNDLTLTEILQTSSNVGTARVGLKMGAERLVGWLRLFGFGERPGSGMPGEPRGVLQNPARMGEIGTATTSFGQGMSATPLQLAAALSAIANGGSLVRPHFVSKVTTAAGQVLLDQQPEVVRQVVPPSVARAVTQMMVAVTEKGGTGTLAALPGVQVAGKTGTAQKADPVTKGYGSRRFSSFMGFAPADDPRIAIYVGLDEPQGDVYGGVVAAPVFREVAAEALRQMGVLLPGAPARAPVAEARVEAPVFQEGFGDQAAVQLDPVGGSSSPGASFDGATEVPDLGGLSARAALRLLAQRGLEAELDGSGRVRAQQPEPLRSVPAGTTVRVTMGVE
jgi:cell division protein FtsI (penicillin-binding protein 3)